MFQAGELEKYAALIRTNYVNAELLILQRAVWYIQRDIDLPEWMSIKLAELVKYNRDCKRIVDSLAKKSRVIQRAISAGYQNGADRAAQELTDANLTSIETTPFQRANTIRALTRDSAGLLDATHPAILRSANALYRNVLDEAVRLGATSGMTQAQCAQYALNAWADKSIVSFKDKSGRKWMLDSYAEMATRTAIKQAQNYGFTDSVTASGEDLVYVTDHPEECPLCRPWEGRVLSISGNDQRYPSVADAKAAGLMHPNCSHTLNLYTPGLSEVPEPKADPENYKLSQKQRGIERDIRRWKRRKVAAITDPEKATAEKHLAFHKAKMEAFLEETGRSHKRHREQITAPGRVLKATTRRKTPISTTPA